MELRKNSLLEVHCSQVLWVLNRLVALVLSPQLVLGELATSREVQRIS